MGDNNMDAAMDNYYSQSDDPGPSLTQSNSSTTTSTSTTNNKRSSPDSPDNLQATIRQESRLTRRQVIWVRPVPPLKNLQTPQKTPASRKSISEKVLTSTDVLNAITPVLAEK